MKSLALKDRSFVSMGIKGRNFRVAMVRTMFWVLLVVGTAFHAMTLPYSPLHWQDEVQITDGGRRFWEVTPWTMCWRPELGDDNVLNGFFYIGSALQSASYELLGHLGPRIVMLVLLVVSTLVVRRYVFAKTHDETLANLFAVLFFAFRDLTTSVRGARVDIVPFLLLFTVLLVLQSSWGRKKPKFLALTVGCLTAVCVFSWTTAVVLLPIVIWELFSYFRAKRFSGKQIVVTSLYVLMGGFPIVMLDLVPFFANPELTLQVFLGGVGANMADKVDLYYETFNYCFFARPYVYVLGFVALIGCFKRDWCLIGGGVAYLVVCYTTRIYAMRMLYFFPYAIIAMMICANVLRQRKMAFVRCATMAVLFLLVGYSFATSVVLKDLIGFSNRGKRDYRYYEAQFSRLLDRGSRVYQPSYEIYYIGRKLGWCQWRVYSVYPGMESKVATRVVLQKVDYYIDRKSRIDDCTRRFLRDAGFVYYAEVTPKPRVESSIFDAIFAKGNGFESLGHYVIYRRRPQS